MSESLAEQVSTVMSSSATVLGDYPYLIFIVIIAINLVFFLLRLKKHASASTITMDAEQLLLMEADQCIVVDENDNVIGHDSKKECHLRSNGLKLHRAFSIFIFDNEGKLLMQKRSKDKITFPSCWANTCCSHPLYVDGEIETESDPNHPNFAIGAKTAARRKLLQELGIPPEQVPLNCMTFMTRLHYRADLDETWGEHEVDYLLVCRPPTNVTINVNPNEVAEARWFSQNELSTFCSVHKDDNIKVINQENSNKNDTNDDTTANNDNASTLEPISPWFAAIEKSPHLLHKWWTALLSSGSSCSLQSFDTVRDTSTIHRGGILFYYRPKGAPVCPTHKHSFMETLSRPSELIDALRFKAFRYVGKRLTGKCFFLFFLVLLFYIIFSHTLDYFYFCKFIFFLLFITGPVLQFEAKRHRDNAQLQEDLIFCEMTLNKVSRSFAAVIAGLHRSLRIPVAIFYLILRALDTIEDETDLTRFTKSSTPKKTGSPQFVKDDVIGFERQIELLKTFYQRLPVINTKYEHKNIDLDTLGIHGIGGDAPAELELLEKLGSVLRVFQALPENHQIVISDITQKMANGMVEYAGRDLASGTETTIEYNKYCYYVAGLVGVGLTRQFVASGLEDGTDKRLDLSIQGPLGGAELSNSMGLFLQKTNIIRDFWEDLLEGRSFWPKDIWSIYSPNGLDKLKNDSTQALACLNHMVTDALSHGKHSLIYLDALKEPSVFAFAAIPQVMAIATMAEVYNEPRLFTGILKIRKSLAASIMLNCKTMDDIHSWFAKFATVILDKIDVNDPNAQETIRLCESLGGIYTPSISRTFNKERGMLRRTFEAFGCWCGFKTPPNSPKSKLN
jgi:farnesyl-diphosphate farnesyltransferase